MPPQPPRRLDLSAQFPTDAAWYVPLIARATLLVDGTVGFHVIVAGHREDLTRLQRAMSC